MKISLEIISPEKIENTLEAEMIVVPAEKGEIGIMDGHIPLLTTLREGDIKIYNKSKVTETFPIKQAICQFSKNKCKILVSA